MNGPIDHQSADPGAPYGGIPLVERTAVKPSENPVGRALNTGQLLKELPVVWIRENSGRSPEPGNVSRAVSNQFKFAASRIMTLLLGTSAS